jgi:poly-gamma-glutamate synthesis protein (capsule biosynthesis protein)
MLPDLSDRTAAAVGGRVRQVHQPGDIVVVSLHWGPNWGYAVTPAEVRFAHRLVDAGADLVHGHSSHHPRPVEVYRDRLVLYGCGDLVDDYEGIAGYERYRDDLRLLYLPRLQAGTGRLLALQMVPMQAHRMRLRPAAPTDRDWLHQTLDRVSRGHGTRILLEPDGLLGMAVEASR